MPLFFLLILSIFALQVHATLTNLKFEDTNGQSVRVRFVYEDREVWKKLTQELAQAPSDKKRKIWEKNFTPFCRRVEHYDGSKKSAIYAPLKLSEGDQEIDLTSETLTTEAAERFLNNPYHQKIYPDFRAVDKILTVMSDPEKRKEERYAGMPTPDLDAGYVQSLTEAQKQKFLDIISQVNLPGDVAIPRKEFSIDAIKKEQALAPLVQGQNAETLNWLLSTPEGHQAGYSTTVLASVDAATSHLS